MSEKKGIDWGTVAMVSWLVFAAYISLMFVICGPAAPVYETPALNFIAIALCVWAIISVCLHLNSKTVDSTGDKKEKGEGR